MKNILLILTFFIFVPQVHAAVIAYDNSLWNQGASATSLTFSFTTSGTNRILFVKSVTTGGRTVTGVTYGGTAMTEATSQHHTSLNENVYWHYLKNPASGANNVVISASASGFIGGGAVSYTGALQTGGVDVATATYFAAQSGDLTTTISVTDAGSWILFGEEAKTNDPASVVNGTFITGTATAADSNGTVSTGSNTIGFHWNASDDVALIGVAFAPVDAPASPAAIIWGFLTLFGDW